MKPVLVLADDITGAAEIAGIAHRLGFTSEIQIQAFYPSNAEVLVIDTNTRSLTVSEATQIMQQVTLQLQGVDVEFLYKKTDSVLRGHVAAELRAVRAALKFSRVLFAPANPSLGRTIASGEYRIAGRPLHETEFLSDPDFPIRTSRVADMFESDPVFTIPDVTDEASLIAASRSMRADTLASGGGDFFNVLLQRLGPRAPRRVTVAWPPRSLTILGSLSNYSKSFLHEKIENGLPFRPIPAQLLLSLPSNPAAARAWVDGCRAVLEERRALIVKIDEIIESSLPRREVAARMAQMVAALVSDLATPLHLLVEGGATASALFQEMGVAAMEVVAEHKRGVVSLKNMKTGSLIFTIKPGSYEWPPDLPTLPANA